MLIFLLIFFILALSACSPCIFMSSNKCLTCSANYTEPSLLSNHKLSINMNIDLFESKCILKNSSIQSKQILIRNNNCSHCVFDNYDNHYTSLLEALIKEHQISLNFIIYTLEIILEEEEGVRKLLLCAS